MAASTPRLNEPDIRSRPRHFVPPVAGPRAAGHRLPAACAAANTLRSRTPPPETRRSSSNGNQVGAASGRGSVQTQRRPAARQVHDGPRHGYLAWLPPPYTHPPPLTIRRRAASMPGHCARRAHERSTPSGEPLPPGTTHRVHRPPRRPAGGRRAVRPTENLVLGIYTTPFFPPRSQNCRLWGLLRHFDLTTGCPPVIKATPEGRQHPAPNRRRTGVG